MQTVTGREIKFRAWDRQQQKMIHGFYGPDILNMYDKIMLPTGLKDKDGEEIYEGDIVELEGTTIADVCWSRKEACFVLVGLKIKRSFCDYSPKFAKVIGNIFEDPKLLEVEK